MISYEKIIEKKLKQFLTVSVLFMMIFQKDLETDQALKLEGEFWWKYFSVMVYLCSHKGSFEIAITYLIWVGAVGTVDSPVVGGGECTRHHS